jgi:hypothetical protein
MTLYLDEDGWEAATWDLSEGVGSGRVRVDIAGAWRIPDVVGTAVTVKIAGTLYAPTDDADGPPVDQCVIVTDDVLARVSVRGVIRRDEWIRIRRRPT